MSKKITGKIDLAQKISEILHVTCVRVTQNEIFVTAYEGAKETFLTTVDDAINRIEHGEKGKQFSGLTL